MLQAVHVNARAVPLQRLLYEQPDMLHGECTNATLLLEGARPSMTIVLLVKELLHQPAPMTFDNTHLYSTPRTFTASRLMYQVTRRLWQPRGPAC